MTPKTLSDMTAWPNAVLSLVCILGMIYFANDRDDQELKWRIFRRVSAAIVVAGCLSNILTLGSYWRMAPLSEPIFKLGIALCTIAYLNDIEAFRSLSVIRKERAANKGHKKALPH